MSAVDVGPGVCPVVSSGPSLVLGLGQLAGAATQVVAQLQPSSDGSARAETGFVRDGTTAPTRNTVQTITANANGGSYVLHFVLPTPSGVRQAGATGPIA